MTKDLNKMKIEINNIYNMDCLKGLKLMKDNSVDITITSPPYNIGKKSQGKGKYQTYEDNMPMQEYYDFIKEVVSELIRVTKYYVFFNFQILTNNNIAYYQLFNEFKYNIKDTIIWHKSNALPSFNDFELTSAFEFVLVFTKKEFAKQRKFEYINKYHFKKQKCNRNVIYDTKYIDKIESIIKNTNISKNKCVVINPTVVFDKDVNVISGPGANIENFEGKDKHNAIYPEYFVKWFLERYTNEEDIVLDPFMGLGGTAYACKDMNRNYIGFEMDKEYIDITKDRLKKISPKLPF